ncbi:centrosomal protein of 112 kDa-like, partial [Mytilus edulis]|uniref:centrosomal protein of 112 kDa-like n=1 Tax=Mytilus edulis TaxID=6550 RepID=UPI0039EF22F6
MERVEADLNKSKEVREKQAREFQKQLDEERHQHERQTVELKMSLEQEKAQYTKEFHQQTEMVHREHRKEIDTMTEQNAYKQDKDSEKIHMMEKQIHELREVVLANQLLKQQLGELELLQKHIQKDHEAETVELKMSLEQEKAQYTKEFHQQTEMKIHMMEKQIHELREVVLANQLLKQQLRELELLQKHIQKDHEAEKIHMMEKQIHELREVVLANQLLKQQLGELELLQKHIQKDHEAETVELKMSLEQEKAQYTKEFHQQTEMVHREHRKEIDTMTEQNAYKQDKDSEKIHMMEKQIHELREVVLANQLLKQQLGELELLQKHIQKDHEAETVELKMSLEQEKAQYTKEFHQQTEMVHREHRKEIDTMTEQNAYKQDKDSEKIHMMEKQIHELREVVLANQLLKQQLGELELLQKHIQKDHEAETVELKMSLEQEKAQYTKEFHQQTEMVHREHRKENRYYDGTKCL